MSFGPAAIVNATGAWVDATLAELGVPSKPLVGGTKGSHFVTYHRGLVEALRGDGIYAEASDGRPVFILPFGDAALVGTTDEPFSGDPDSARATSAELEYLIDAIHHVFPQIALAESDIELVYSGVRPLPASGPTTPAAITRKHWLEEHSERLCSLLFDRRRQAHHLPLVGRERGANDPRTDWHKAHGKQPRTTTAGRIVVGCGLTGIGCGGGSPIARAIFFARRKHHRRAPALRQPHGACNLAVLRGEIDFY